MNEHEQMREALQAIETVMEDAYHRHFAECCGRGQGSCCGDFIEQWSQEDHKILDTLSPIQRKLSQALSAPAQQAEPVSEENRLEAAGKVANDLGVKTTDAYRIIAAYTHPAQPVESAATPEEFNAQSFFSLWSSYCDKKMEIEDLKVVNEQLLGALKKIVECDASGLPVRTFQQREEIAKAAIADAEKAKGGV